MPRILAFPEFGEVFEGFLDEGLRERLLGLHPELDELLGLTDRVVLSGRELGVGTVVGFLGLAESAAEIVEILHEPRELLVKRCSLLGDLLGVAGLGLLPPEMGDRAHHEEQGGGTHQQHVAVPGIPEEVPLVGDGHHEGRLQRDEHDDEVERLESVEFLVVLLGEAADVGLEGGNVSLERGLARGVVLRRDGLLVGVERDLGIDHQAAVARQLDHHVGLEAASLLGRVAHLHMVFLPLAEAGGLENLLKDEFPVVALDLVGSLEGGGQVAGLLADAPVEFREHLHLLLELHAVLALLHVDFLDLLAELPELDLERIKEGPEAFLVLLGESLGFLLEDFTRQGLELVGERFPGLVEELDLLGRGLPFLGQRGLGARPRDALLLQAGADLRKLRLKLTDPLLPEREPLPQRPAVGGSPGAPQQQDHERDQADQECEKSREVGIQIYAGCYCI